MEPGPQSAADDAAARAPVAGVDAGAIDLEALLRRERPALDAFYRELFEPLYAFVYWRVGGVRQDAEDVTQETFLTALGSLASFERRSSLHTWVCGIAKNLAHARVRARGRAPAATDVAPPAVPLPDAQLERAQSERLVGQALTELPPRYQQALLDKYVHQHSFAEMAQVGGSTAKAVESTVQRAKRALGEALARLGRHGGSDE